MSGQVSMETISEQELCKIIGYNLA
jgi:hypothetical protein